MLQGIPYRKALIGGTLAVVSAAMFSAQPVAPAKPLVIGLNGVPRTLSAKLNQAGGGNQKSVGATAALMIFAVCLALFE